MPNQLPAINHIVVLMLENRSFDQTLHPYLMPGADPGEGFLNPNFQLFSIADRKGP